MQRKCENLVNNKTQNKIVSTAEEEEHNENEEEEKESCSLSLSEKDELINGLKDLYNASDKIE